MRKPAAKDGVGQLALQIAFPQEKTSHTTEETQDNGPRASRAPLPPRSQTDPKWKWYSLYDKVFALPNLEAAWEKVRANDGAPGIDGVSVARFGRDTPDRLSNLSTDLRNKNYRPAPVRRV